MYQGDINAIRAYTAHAADSMCLGGLRLKLNKIRAAIQVMSCAYDNHTHVHAQGYFFNILMYLFVCFVPIQCVLLQYMPLLPHYGNNLEDITDDRLSATTLPGACTGIFIIPRNTEAQPRLPPALQVFGACSLMPATC